MGNHLVIGASGVMGTAAIRAIRHHFGKEPIIIANWYGKEDTGEQIEQADHTIFGDITDLDCLDKIKSISEGTFDFIYYATALGEVGFPIEQATPEEIAHSNSLSFDPIPVLEEKFEIGTIVAYSTFYLIKHQISSYGAMAYSKEAIEKWVVQPGKSKHACIRAGLFPSHSSRAIKLLLRKMAKNVEKMNDPLLLSYFKGVNSSEGIKRFEEGIFKEEEETYGDSRTDADSLYEAHLALFKSDNPVFVNICGKKIWMSDTPLLIQSVIG
ncbi:MAG: hypothetical protein ACE5EK_05625 [Nitrospinales bacterium]